MAITEVLVLVLTFVILLGIGLPIAFSIAISATITLLLSVPALSTLTTVAQRMATSLDSFTLLAIPFFILAGQLMNSGGIARRLIDFARALVGALPGGLAFVNIVANMLFGAISGSAVASASAIGGAMGPRMEKEGYDKAYSAAVNISSATTGLIIPPSNTLIVFSLASGGVSIAALFMAGYLPGLLIGGLLMLSAGVIAKKRNYPRGDKASFAEIGRTLVSAMPSLLMLVVVIGGIVNGLFTATEASAIAVLYSGCLAVAYREVNLQHIRPLLLDTIKTTSIVLFLVATSMALSWVMAYENIPQTITDVLLGISDNPIIILLIINVILLAVGVFMDMTPAVLIFTPIFLPVVAATGMDPVHFGIMMILNLCIGLCTPPVGSVLFVGCSVAKIKIQSVIKPLLPLFITMLVGLMIVTFIPQISLFLPKALGLIE
jgi:tripartite ATP-independent transporter DctM subunit